MANGMWTRMGASGTSVIIVPKTITKELEDKMRACIEQFMKKAKAEEARSLKLVRLHVEKTLSLSLTNHKDVIKRLMHGILQREGPSGAAPTEPTRPEIRIAKTPATWWKQDERMDALAMGINRLYHYAVDHSECNLDVIESLCNLLPVIESPDLRRLIILYARQLASTLIGKEEQPEWIPGSKPTPSQVVDTITSMHIFQLVGLQHSRANELRAFLATSPYQPQHYFGWDPTTSCPSPDANHTSYQMISNALTVLWYAHSVDVSLGCSYASVLKWLSAYYPYQGPSSLTELEYMDQCYCICRAIMTLSNWGSLLMAVDLMPNEYYFLLAHLDIQIARGDVHLIGEFTRALKCFGASVDRGVSFSLCYPQSFTSSSPDETPQEVVHKATVALYALCEPSFAGYAPGIADPQLHAILERNATTEHLRTEENTDSFESDLKRNLMKQSVRRLMEKASTMDAKLIPLDDSLQRIQALLEGTADVKTLDAKDAMQMLQELSAMKLTVATLKETGVGRSVNKLRKHPSEAVSSASQALVAKWKKELLG